jgi:hypothetical protein
MAGAVACIEGKERPKVGDKFYECTTSLKNCSKLEKPVKITATVSTQYHPNQYPTDEKFEVNDLLYLNAIWRVEDIELPKLRGSILVRTDFQRKNITSKDFLTLAFSSFLDIENVYIAYDSRAHPKPTWLTSGYVREEKAPGVPYHVTISMPDKTTAAWDPLALEVWRLKKGQKTPGQPMGTQELNIPGNRYGNPAWPGVPQDNTAMYFVMVKRTETPDCTKGEIMVKEGLVGCDTSEQAARVLAYNRCQARKHPLDPFNLQCLEPVCHPETYCPAQSGLVQKRSFPYSSVIEFNPSKFKSQAGIRILRHMYKKNVSGELHFEYLLDKFGNYLEGMQINSMLLKVDPLKTDIGTYTDIVISLLEAVTATCKMKQGKPPPWASPCDWYEIPKEQFRTSIAAEEGGVKFIYVARNRLPLVIEIQHKNRTFQIKGGPQSTEVGYNGKTARLDIDIDLWGHFLNFAPTAVGGRESTRLVECSRGRNNVSSNKDPVFLDASGSFEVYDDPIPSSAHKWQEDYGLVTEKYWGSGRKVTIAEHQLPYGVHHMTLLIRDDFGVADTDTFEVEVQDEIAPNLTVPPDVHFLLVPPNTAPVKLNIGQATATDSCSDSVMITNDAPKDGRFPLGVTIITWTADDGRGNVTTKTQKVNVYTAWEKKPGIHPGPIEKSPSPAPDKAAWCNQFSQMSLSHSTENSLRGCGFTGGRWGPDYNTHYQWCMNTTREAAEAVNTQRQVALLGACQRAQQPQPWQPPQPVPTPQPTPQPPSPDQGRCDQYARTAVAQSQRNVYEGCGFGGPRWILEYDPHYQWCLQMPQFLADLETMERDRALTQDCARALPPPQPGPAPLPPPGQPSPPPPAPRPPPGDFNRCQQYAQTAVAQNQRNVQMRCGFTGPRWSSDLQLHHQWCMGVPRASADAETSARENALRNSCPQQLPRVM